VAEAKTLLNDHIDGGRHSAAHAMQRLSAPFSKEVLLWGL
jgi:hypothetical protein